MVYEEEGFCLGFPDINIILKRSNNLVAKKVRMEADYILEDNYRIKNAIEKLGMRRIKTYRIYEKILS